MPNRKKKILLEEIINTTTSESVTQWHLFIFCEVCLPFSMADRCCACVRAAEALLGSSSGLVRGYYCYDQTGDMVGYFFVFCFSVSQGGRAARGVTMNGRIARAPPVVRRLLGACLSVYLSVCVVCLSVLPIVIVVSTNTYIYNLLIHGKKVSVLVFIAVRIHHTYIYTSRYITCISFYYYALLARRVVAFFLAAQLLL